jgi:hypothetical protein
LLSSIAACPGSIQNNYGDLARHAVPLIPFPLSPFSHTPPQGHWEPLPNHYRFFIEKECPPRFVVCVRGYNVLRERSRKGGQVQTIIASELYIDHGLFSGLVAMSEMRELLDDLYESLD